ncbi:MAG TPA: rod shape-determining protein RodA [Bacteroidales bacterium]|nr:MAG: rod shape-determining protein RodA [Bacteroidetes bacterium GWE2_42_24]OFY28837.1 MAG: rod shape-determining protein RodA [Bacteroidetes bacterium GWF2_43_11]HAQ65864.1 rod shape-determining protein RodA [Bacteroidales bacterium]HBZ67668.1 rod shape-determining protein RodA [Bacteroidales bacterium]
MRERKNVFQNADKVMIVIYILLVLMGWLNIYAAVYDDTHSSIFDLSTNYGKQALWIGTSALLIFLIMMTEARFFSSFSYVIYVGIILLLVLVLGVGREVAGSKSWIEIGSFRLQPAELAKFATNLALAAYLGRTHVNIQTLSTKVVVAIILGIPPILILAQNDTGSAIVYATFILVLFREGLSGGFLVAGFVAAVLFVMSLLVNQWIVIGSAAVILALIAWRWQRGRRPWVPLIGIFLISAAFVFSVDYTFHKVLEPHQKERINVLLGKETDLKGAGYNVHQSLIAIGSGGIVGKGYLNGTQTKYNYVPEQSTDFIFCTVGEEWGFVGSTVVLGLFLALLIRIILQAERQRTAFARIYGYGVASILFFHLAINVGMAIGLLPVVGIPLPFFSYGGSSLWSFTILLFIFIKLDSHRNEVV